MASKWLDTIDDHINLVETSQRMKYNMEKFHYNPIPYTEQVGNLFPNIETQYLYSYFPSLIISSYMVGQISIP